MNGNLDSASCGKIQKAYGKAASDGLYMFELLNERIDTMSGSEPQTMEDVFETQAEKCNVGSLLPEISAKD